MAFDIHDHRRRPGPLGEHRTERTEQHVVDLCAERLRHLTQQPLRVFRPEGGHDVLGCGHGVGSGGVAGQGRCLGFGLVPVLRLRRDLRCAGQLLQPLGPPHEGRRLRRQDRLCAFGCLLVCRGKVLQEHRPGHRVDHQVVRHHQDQAAQFAAVEQCHPDQRATGQVQARLDLGGQRLQGLGVGVDHRHHVGRFRRYDTAGPGSVPALEP